MYIYRFSLFFCFFIVLTMKQPHIHSQFLIATSLEITSIVYTGSNTSFQRSPLESSLFADTCQYAMREIPQNSSLDELYGSR